MHVERRTLGINESRDELRRGTQPGAAFGGDGQGVVRGVRELNSRHERDTGKVDRSPTLAFDQRPQPGVGRNEPCVSQREILGALHVDGHNACRQYGRRENEMTIDIELGREFGSCPLPNVDGLPRLDGRLTARRCQNPDAEQSC